MKRKLTVGINPLSLLWTFFSILLFVNCSARAEIHTLVSLQKPYTVQTPDAIAVQDAVQNILNQVGIAYNFDSSHTNTAPICENPITPDIVNLTWSEALEAILGPKELTYRIEASKVVLYKKSAYPTVASLALNYFPINTGSTAPTSTSAITLVTINSPVNITATPAAGYHFKNWTSSSSDIIFANSMDNTTTVTFTAQIDSTVIAVFEKDDIASGLVAYYPFNADAADASGNGNDGTVNGAALAPDRFGNANRAYLFDGTSNYINCGDSTLLDLSTFSLSYWVKSDHVPGTADISLILSKGENYSSAWDHTTTPKPGISFYDGTYWHNSISTSSYAANTWYHVVATYNKRNLTVYVNGVSNNTVFASEVPVTNTDPFCIGAANVSSDFFKGSIDDVRIYNRALAPSEITKLYALPTVKITTASSPATAGAVTPSPNIVVNSGDPVTITAYPKAGYRFSNWVVSGNGIVNEPNSQITTINATAACTVTAVFVSDKTHTLVSLFAPYPIAPTDKILVSNAVSKCLTQAGIQYNAAASTANIDPVDKQYCHPDIRNLTWSDALVEILDPVGLTYKIASSKVVLYRQDQFQNQSTLVMNYLPDGSGITVPTSGPVTTTVENDTLFGIEASPSANYHFINWTGAAGATITDANSPMTTAKTLNDTTITANFAHDTNDLTIAVTGSGNTSPVPGTSALNTATALPIIATPSANWHFVNWQLNSGSAAIANPNAISTTVTLSGVHGSPAGLTANFAHDKGTLTVKKTGGGNVNIGTASYDTATAVDIVASPDKGQHFVNWTVSGSAAVTDINDPTSTITLTGANNSTATLTANFAIDNYAIVFQADPNGSVTGALSQNVNYGSNCSQVTAVPNTDYHLLNWTGTGGFVTTGANPLTVTNVQNPMIITANFARNMGTVSVGQIGDGTVTGAGTFDTNTAQNISATPSAGFTFINWTATGEGAIANTNDPSTTATLTGLDGCTFTATANFFNASTNTVNSGDTIPLSGDSKGGMKVYRISVPSGKKFLTATLTGISGDCDLYARFGKVPSLLSYDYKSTNGPDTSESITINSPIEGDFYFLIYAYADYSGAVFSASFGDTGLSVPAMLTSSQGDFTDKVSLTWSDCSGSGATSYDIYRSKEDSADLSTFLKNVTGTAGDDLTAMTGTHYYYWVKSRNDAGTSGFGEPIQGWLRDGTTVKLTNGAPVTVSGDTGTTKKFRITVPATVPPAASISLLEIKTGSGTGDCDLTVEKDGVFLKYGVKTTNNELIQLENPVPGDYIISLYANTKYSGLTLTAKYYNAKPLPPTTVTASKGASSDEIFISWLASPGAVSYEIWRGTTAVSTALTTVKIDEVSDTSYTDIGPLAAGITYSYWIKAKNGSGTSVFSAIASGNVLNVPATPTSVTVSNGTYFDKIVITWPKVTGATFCEVWRNTTNSFGSAGKIANIAYDSSLATYAYNDIGGADPKPGQSYYYWVKAGNGNGLSAPKASATAGSIRKTPPAAVTASKGTFFNKVKITWTAVAGATGYDVYRSLTNNSGTADRLIPASPITGTEYYDDSLSGTTTTYYYWVKATFNGYATDFSTPSSSGYAKTSLQTLTAPAMKSVSKGEGPYINIVWGEVPLAVTYNVYRKKNTADAWDILATGITGFSYTDLTADPAGQTFLYCVKSVNGETPCPYSAAMSGYAAVKLTASIKDNSFSDPGLTAGKGVSKVYKISVPIGTTRLVAKAENVTGSCDLYAKIACYPTTTAYNAVGTLIAGTKADKTLTVANPASGEWFIMIYGSGTTGYGNADLSINCYTSTDIIFTQVPSNDQSVPFTASFKGQVRDRAGAGIGGLTVGVRNPVTGLSTWLPVKTDTYGNFTYSTTISADGEYTYDFFFSTIPDYTRSIGSWTVKTKRNPRETNGFFDFSGYLAASQEDLTSSDKPSLGEMQQYMSIRRGFADGPAARESEDYWASLTVKTAPSDPNIASKLDSGLYLILYGVEGAAVGNGMKAEPGLTPSPLLVRVSSDRQSDVLENLRGAGIIGDILAGNVAAGGIGVVTVTAISNPDEVSDGFYDISLLAEEQLDLLANIAGGSATFSEDRKYGDVPAKSYRVTLSGSSRELNILTSCFLK